FKVGVADLRRTWSRIEHAVELRFGNASTAGEERYVVAARGKLVREQRDDPFDAAIPKRRYGDPRRRDLRDLQIKRAGSVLLGHDLLLGLFCEAQPFADAKLPAQGKSDHFRIDRVLHEADLADAVFDRCSATAPGAVESISVHPVPHVLLCLRRGSSGPDRRTKRRSDSLQGTES